MITTGSKKINLMPDNPIAISEAEAKKNGYCPITENLSRSPEDMAFMFTVLKDNAGSNCVVAGNAVWRHKGEIKNRNNRRLESYREKK